MGVRFPYLARAGVEQGSGATRAGGGGHDGSRWRRSKTGEEGHGGGVACGGGWPRGAPIYRRGKAVEGRGAGGGDRRASRGDINSAPAICGRRGVACAPRPASRGGARTWSVAVADVELGSLSRVEAAQGGRRCSDRRAARCRPGPRTGPRVRRTGRAQAGRGACAWSPPSGTGARWRASWR